MTDRKVYLVCNAHLDPVWLWQRTEGMAEALSTFRIAADFCERYDNFVFNHNESVLYEWVQEHEPELFARIQKLVKQGKWRIIGGWYLQPDVIMPCGESIIRQIRVGQEFFAKHFENIPKTAIGVDAFGHSRGLVQILKKCGYDNYVYLRPRETECGPFVWKGFDGSEVHTFKLYEWYNTPKGEALKRVKQYLKDFPQRKLNLLTWGIGNHGGGPSEKDLQDMNDFAEQQKDISFVHTDFEDYFAEVDKSKLNTVETSLMHCMVGCYTSMARIKQGHRRLENKLNLCEKMLWQSGVDFDEKQLEQAEKALLFTQFHDVLPGTCVRKAEEDSLRLLGYGEEITDRLIAKAFFKLCSGQPKAKEAEIPVLIYNPHPYSVEGDFEVEFQLAEQNHPRNGIYDVKVRDEEGVFVPCQLEQEDSAHGMDWRKKIVFHTVLKPMEISRFDCVTELDKEYTRIKPHSETEEHIVLENDSLSIQINKKTGLVDKYLLDGKAIINSIMLKAYRDNADPWGMEVDGFEECIGEFEPDHFVKIIENGAVRTKVQAGFRYHKSFAVMTYIFSKHSKALDIDVKLLVNDENTMFKLCVDTVLDNPKTMVQTMFGTEEMRNDGKEFPFQKWCGLQDKQNAVYVMNNGTYGGSAKDSELRISLLRTAVYSAHPVEDIPLTGEDRMYEHIDMGEREFQFRLLVNPGYVDYEAELFNQNPFILSFFPSGVGEKVKQAVSVDNKYIILSALRKTKEGDLIRLFNSNNKNQSCVLSFLGDLQTILFAPFEVKTFVKDKNGFRETDMLGK